MGTESAPSLVLLASPLLGPAVWARVAPDLRSRGWKVLVPSPYGAVAEPADVLRHLEAELPVDLPMVLVAHSNAGLYVAALAHARDVRGVVFADAGIPSDAPATPTAPGTLRDRLAGLADEEGRLPEWTRWWPAEVTAGLFPDEEARRSVEGEEPRLPLAYFDASVPSPPGWHSVPAAYLAFGDTYADERRVAEQRAWPVITVRGGHLHPLVEPAEVCEALLGLLGRMGLSSA